MPFFPYHCHHFFVAMNSTSDLLALALGPVAAIFAYIYWRDRYEREPLKHLIISFILGILCAFPVLVIGKWLEAATEAHINTHNPLSTAVHAFIVVALVEEGMKFLALMLYMYRKREFDEPYDGIMYAVAVSLGFAAIENVLYVFGAKEDAFQVGLMRMFTAVPAHAVFAIIMGYFVGKAKFQKRGIPAFTILLGLFGAVLFHGFYDYCLFLGDAAIAIWSFVSLIVGLLLARRAIRAHSEDSPHRNTIQ